MKGYDILGQQDEYPPPPPHIYPITNISFFNIQRGQYVTLVNRLDFYEPPPVELYTKLSLGTYFLIFWGIHFIHCLTIFIIDKKFGTNIPQSTTFWQRFVHSWQKSNFPVPYKNWHEENGTCQDHIKRKNAVKEEVLTSIIINTIFNMILLFPLVILCKYMILCKTYNLFVKLDFFSIK